MLHGGVAMRKENVLCQISCGGVCEIVKLSASECEIMSTEDWVAI